MAEPQRRRRRPAVSCSLCRRRKIRCNREYPCSNCTRSRNNTCVYDNHPSHQPQEQGSSSRRTELRPAIKYRQPHDSTPNDQASTLSRDSVNPSHPSVSSVASSASASTPTSQPSCEDVESMKSRILQLEQQLFKATQKSFQLPIAAVASNTEAPASCPFDHESGLFGQCQTINRAMMHKNRLFGQSHWGGVVPLFRDMFETLEPYVRGETSKAFSSLQRCKALARVIKSQRSPPWPSPPMPDLPPKNVADELVNCYLLTTESFCRILHIPTFRRDYDALWVSDSKPDAASLVQIKLVLAIGAITYDEQFSLRTSAIRWVYEAHTWFSDPKFKQRLGIQYLQTNLLLLIARERTAVGGDFVWIAAGALLRTAVCMGLHRDPARLPKRPAFVAEMRRRLWNSILEITLQSSLTSGGPPFLSLDDFDTEPPSNLDDDQLLAENPVSKPENEFTQASIAIALRKTFPLRLAVAKLLNDLRSHGTYEEVLRLDAGLRKSHNTLRRTLRGYDSGIRHSPSPFEMRVVDFVMHRYLLSLHIPLFSPALHETAYAYSRKVVVETSQKIWFAAYPSSSIMTAQSRNDAASSDRDDLARLAVCSTGFFRTVTIQASFLLAAEIKAQLQEDDSLDIVRPDLLSVLDEAKTWNLQCIEAGETGIKGYIFTSLVAAHIEGLMQGVGKEEFPKLLVQVAEQAEEKCLPMLEEKVAQRRTVGTVDGLNQMTLSTPPDLIEDWDLMMSDAQVDFGNAEPMSWLFGGEVVQEPSLW